MVQFPSVASMTFMFKRLVADPVVTLPANV